MGPLGPTKGNAQLTRQNDISFTLFKLVYCLAREYFSVTVWFIKCVRFFKKRHHTAKTAWCSVTRDPSTIFLATNFTQKMPEISNSTYSSLFMLENIWYHHLTWSGPNSHKLWVFFPFVGPRGPILCIWGLNSATATSATLKQLNIMKCNIEIGQHHTV